MRTLCAQRRKTAFVELGSYGPIIREIAPKFKVRNGALAVRPDFRGDRVDSAQFFPLIRIKAVIKGDLMLGKYIAPFCLVLLSSCEREVPIAPIYKKDDPLAQLALSTAHREYPEYFMTANQVGATQSIVQYQVYGREHECVGFKNTSGIIIEMSLPLYCFNKKTGKLAYKL